MNKRMLFHVRGHNMMKFLTVALVPVALLLCQCRPGNPKTGIYAQKVLKQSGSCQTLTAKPLVLIGVTNKPDTLNFIAPMPNGGGAYITIPSSGGEKAVC